MTLFITTPNIIYEISEVYIVALTFIIVFSVTKISMEVTQKLRKKKNQKEIKLANPRGGKIGLQFSEDSESALNILRCITTNKKYIVKDPKIRDLIFDLVNAKVQNESLILAPNFIRFLALNLLKEDKSLMIKIGTVVISSTHRARLISRIVGTSVIAFIGALFNLLPYAIFLAVIYFSETENCGFRCGDHFEHVPQESPVVVTGERASGHLAIAENDQAHQVQLYVPSDSKTVINKEKNLVTRTYKPARKKARQVNFSDFRKTDPVLSQFQNLEEPEVPQKVCRIGHIFE